MCLVLHRLQMTPKNLKGNKGKKVKTLSTSQKIDINFPPGRPTADNIESICQNQKLRPLYSVKCLPRSDYEWLTRQAKTINRIEKGFKQCCKKKMEMLSCADRKVRQETFKQILCSLVILSFCLHLRFSGSRSLKSFARARTVNRWISTVAPRVMEKTTNTSVSRTFLPTHITI